MIRIETDPNFVNRIANSEAVRPFIRPDGAPTDWTPALVHRPSVSGIIVLSNGEDAVAVFEATGWQTFKTHLLFAASCRGRRALDAYHEMLAWMFDRGALVIWGVVPRLNRKAIRFGRALGFSIIGGDENETHLAIAAAA